MRHGVLRTVTLAVICVGAITLTVSAQEGGVINSWLQQHQQEGAAPAADAERAVRARIAAVREARATTVAMPRSGRWQSARFGTDARPWLAQVQRNIVDNSLAGQLTVIGSSRIGAAKISGRIEGSACAGVVTDDHGTQLASFTGTVTAAGMSGTYATPDGDSGTWETEAPLRGE